MIRIAEHLILSVAEAAMDALTRVSILEGVLDVPPWSLARRDSFQLAAPMRQIQAQIPNIDPRWVSTRDEGLYRAILQTARAISGSSELADDITMEILSGNTRGSVKGGQLYDIGVKLRQEILEGEGFSTAKSWLIKHTKHRALQRGPATKHRSLTQLTDEGDVSLDLPSGAFGQDNEMEVLRRLLDGPSGDVIRNKIRKDFAEYFEDSPAKLAVFDIWLNDPTADATEIGRRVGNLAVYEKKGVPVVIRFNTREEMRAWQLAHPGSIISATLTSRIIREIQAAMRLYMERFFKRHPKLLREIHLRSEVEQLGYGGRLAAERKKLDEISRGPR